MRRIPLHRVEPPFSPTKPPASLAVNSTALIVRRPVASILAEPVTTAGWTPSPESWPAIASIAVWGPRRCCPRSALVSTLMSGTLPAGVVIVRLDGQREPAGGRVWPDRGRDGGCIDRVQQASGHVSRRSRARTRRTHLRSLQFTCASGAQQNSPTAEVQPSIMSTNPHTADAWHYPTVAPDDPVAPSTRRIPRCALGPPSNHRHPGRHVRASGDEETSGGHATRRR
jgi:hypothetical protein